MTPNHNLYVAKGNSFGRFLSGNTRKYDFELSTPDKFFKKSKRFKKSMNWVGENIENIVIPGYTRNSINRNYILEDKVFNLKNFLMFLGFYTAEGCCNSKKGEISIAACNDGTKKAINEQKAFEEVLLLNNLPINKIMVDKSALIYRIYDKPLCYWLEKNINKGAYNKKVPDFIKSLTPELIKIYLQWLYFGDGHKSKTAETLYTISKKLSDDVQELILKVGDTFGYYIDYVERRNKNKDKKRYLSLQNTLVFNKL